MKSLFGKFRFPLYAWISLVFFIVAHVLLILNLNGSKHHLYLLVWWPYILTADGLVYRRKGSSLLTHHPKKFFQLLPLSVAFWLVFELLNVVLNNWHYVMVPENTVFRWIAYTICFATVLPAIFETKEMLDAYGLFKNSRVRAIVSSTRWHKPFIIIGLAFIILPLLWPQYYFPLIWGAFIFLLEPLNHRMGARSLMCQWEQGSLRTFYLFLVAGAICGLLWEFWNFWSITKWVYTIPHVGWLKVFEMPILGFWGFPPFAVECYVMMNTVSLIRKIDSWKHASYLANIPKSIRILLPGLMVLLFFLYAFYMIDINSVISWRL
jgi:hypothetical protein